MGEANLHVIDSPLFKRCPSGCNCVLFGKRTDEDELPPDPEVLPRTEVPLPGAPLDDEDEDEEDDALEDEGVLRSRVVTPLRMPFDNAIWDVLVKFNQPHKSRSKEHSPCTAMAFMGSAAAVGQDRERERKRDTRRQREREKNDAEEREKRDESMRIKRETENKRGAKRRKPLVMQAHLFCCRE